MSYLFSADVAPAARVPIVRDAILRHVRENVAPGETLDTRTLMAQVWPAPTHADYTPERKAAIGIALALAAKEFNGVCAMRGPPDPKRKYMGKPVRRWLWYHPEEKTAAGFNCPHCGKPVTGIQGTG